MHLKNIFLTSVFLISSITIAQVEENKQPFNFKEFKTEQECTDFIDNVASVWSIETEPLLNLTPMSNMSPQHLTDMSPQQLVDFNDIKNLRKKCIEAIHYLKYTKKYDEAEIKKYKYALMETIHPWVDSAEQYKEDYLINADAAELYLEMGLDPFQEFSSKDDIRTVSYKELIDGLYEGSDKFPEIKSRNCNSWNPFKWDAECSDIKRVRNKINKLEKRKK